MNESQQRKALSPTSLDIFKNAYAMSPVEKINAIKRGIPANRIKSLAADMSLPQTTVLNSMGLSRAKVRSKATQMALLSKGDSALVLGLESLIGQVQFMVTESGDPSGFDPAKWVGRWISSPNRALGGEPPSFYMDTVDGQRIVAQLLALAQSGAYG
jgi:hypothetical protein